MPPKRDGGYAPLLDVDDDNMNPVKWKSFFVQLEGNTTGAHLGIVEKVKSTRHIQMSSPEESDYLLVFCPIVSRAGTDVGVALESIPDNKQAVLVVMHHTFDTRYVLSNSRKLVNKPNVQCVVDVLFYDGALLSCDANDTAWMELQNFLGVTPLHRVLPDLQVLRIFYRNWLRPRRSVAWFCGVVGVTVMVVAVVYLVKTHMQE